LHGNQLDCRKNETESNEEILRKEINVKQCETQYINGELMNSPLCDKTDHYKRGTVM